EGRLVTPEPRFRRDGTPREGGLYVSSSGDVADLSPFNRMLVHLKKFGIGLFGGKNSSKIIGSEWNEIAEGTVNFAWALYNPEGGFHLTAPQSDRVWHLVMAVASGDILHLGDIHNLLAGISGNPVALAKLIWQMGNQLRSGNGVNGILPYLPHV